MVICAAGGGNNIVTEKKVRRTLRKTETFINNVHHSIRIEYKYFYLPITETRLIILFFLNLFESLLGRVYTIPTLYAFELIRLLFL